jgi:hypothetical protein
MLALSRPNLNLDGANLGWPSGLRCFEVELQCLFQIGKSLVFAFTLAGDIRLQELRNVPIAFAPYDSREGSLHDHILSYGAPLGC